MATKKPWLAAVLNIVVSGLGYIYVGRRKLFGSLLVFSELSGVVWVFTNLSVLEDVTNIWTTLAAVFLATGMAIDAYCDAKIV